MRVLFSSTSGHGHVIPMLPLARAFRQAGHDVLWATAEQAMPLVTASGTEAVASGAHGAEEAALRAAVRTEKEPAGPARAAYVFPRMFGEALTPPMAADLVGHRPGLATGPAHPRARRSWPHRWWRPSSGCPASPTPSGRRRRLSPWSQVGQPACRAVAGARPRGADVRRRAPRSGYLDICPQSVQTMPVDHITREDSRCGPVDAGPRSRAGGRHSCTSRLGTRPEPDRPAR